MQAIPEVDDSYVKKSLLRLAVALYFLKYNCDHVTVVGWMHPRVGSTWLGCITVGRIL